MALLCNVTTKTLEHYTYDNEKQALIKARELKQRNLSVTVILSKGLYYVEHPASDVVRSWEKELFRYIP